MRIWFIGGGEFAAACLVELVTRHAVRFEKIVTGEPAKSGRGLKKNMSATERAALGLGLPVERAGKLGENEALKAEMRNPPDLAFVVDFGQLITEPFLNGPKHGCLNIHPSLLPRWRGAAPVPRAILNGDTVTGVTVFRLVREMDAGPILRTLEIPLPINANSTELFKILASAGSQIAAQSVKSIIEGYCQFSEQNSEFATYAAKLDKAEARLSWNSGSLLAHNTVRAFDSSIGAFAMVLGKRLKVWRTVLCCAGSAPGTLLSTDGDPVVACLDGAVRLVEVQAEGKRRVSGAEWLRGTRLKEGDVLTE